MKTDAGCWEFTYSRWNIKQSVSWKWCKAFYSHSSPSITYFPQHCAPLVASDSTTSWGQVFKHWSLWENSSHSNHHRLQLEILSLIQLKPFIRKQTIKRRGISYYQLLFPNASDYWKWRKLNWM